MKFTPQACCLILIWPCPGAGISICSKVRTSGPPTLWTRTAATIVSLPGQTGLSLLRLSGGIIGGAGPSARLARVMAAPRAPSCTSAPARDAQVGAGDVGRLVRQQIQHALRDLVGRAGASDRHAAHVLLDAARRLDVGVDHAGANAVDADALARQFAAGADHHGVDRALGGGVPVAFGGAADDGRHRRYHDARAALPV